MNDRIEALYRDIIELATSNGRMVGTPGHGRAKAYLLRRMEQLRLEPYKGSSYELPYRRGGNEFTNLVGRIPGESHLAPILLGAHYDTAGPYPGADDNAAAVAILLSLATELRALARPRPFVIALFDAEEPPHYLTPSMGSTVFYEEQRHGEIYCAMIMDLVGHEVPRPGLEDLLFITGLESDPAWPQVLAQAATVSGVRVIASLNRYAGDVSDHHIFRVNRRPYLFLTCGRWQHYHMPSDTPEKLNFDKIMAVRACLLELAGGAAQARLEGPFEGYDSTPFECECIRRALGPLSTQLGLDESCNRQAIDRLAALFLDAGI